MLFTMSQDSSSSSVLLFKWEEEEQQHIVQFSICMYLRLAEDKNEFCQFHRISVWRDCSYKTLEICLLHAKNKSFLSSLAPKAIKCRFEKMELYTSIGVN